MQVTSKEVVDGVTSTHYACNFTVTTTGDGHWGCEAGRQVHVTGIVVIEEECDDMLLKQVNVEHDSTADVYTDTGFESAISEAVGYDVQFTEQGMQDDGYASMEAYEAVDA